MKNFINTLCMTLFLGTCMFSCSNDDLSECIPEQNARNLKMPEEYKVIGKVHNEGLEAAFSALRKHYEVQTRVAGKSQKLTKEQCLKITVGALYEFCADKGYYVDKKSTTFTINDVITKNIVELLN